MYLEDFSNNSLVFDDWKIKNSIIKKVGNHCCIAVIDVKCNHYISSIYALNWNSMINYCI